MVKLLLSETKGYKWHTIGEVSFRGYFQYLGEDNKVFRDEEAIREFEGVSTLDELKSILQKLDGLFSLIICKSSYVLAAVDRARSLPLFFSQDVISDSAEEIRKELSIAKESVNIDNYLEFVSVSYIIGHRTAYSEISQLDLGEMVKIENGSFSYEKYFHHLNKVVERPVDDIKKELTKVAYDTFNRLKAVIAGRPVVLSMSGGYDSRFVACMLKNVGVEDVSCYSYGRKDSFEVAQARLNAEALGFRWIYVEMTDKKVEDCLDEVGLEYMDSYGGHDYSAYLQNFPAVRELHNMKWIKPGSVFLTGLCGDMPTGEYVETEDPLKNYNSKTVANEIYDLLFNSFEMESSFKLKWCNAMELEIQSLPICIKDYQSYQSVVDCIYTGTCHSHAYMHMNSVHTFFGYEWLLPYWSVDLLKTWYSVPARYRYKQNLYEEWLLDEICKPYGIGQKKTVAFYSTDKWRRKIQYAIGGCVVYFLLHLGVPFRRKQDHNNFAPLELKLFKNIQSKGCVYYRKSGIVHLLVQYLAEKRYGVDNYRYFYKHTSLKV